MVKLQRLVLISLVGFGLTACGAGSAPPPAAHAKQLFIGQDLGAIRGYMASECCPRPDGLTAYVDFYDILTPDDFGGLGVDTDGEDAGFEFNWGAGPVSAYRTATEFDIDGLAIGLSIKENGHPGNLDRLVDGEFDDEARQLARFFAKIEGPVYLRIGYEFDGAWNHGYEDAPRFITAWRWIVDVLRQEGAANVETVWQASATVTDEVLDRRHEDISQWYPGDDYVDWMAFSWFMNPHETIQVASEYDPGTPLVLAQEVLALARKHGKPVMIAEASPQGMDLNDGALAHHHAIWDGPSGTGRVEMTDDELWNHWFAPLFQLLSDNRDVIHILAYINADWDSQPMWGAPYREGFWGDSRLETNDEIATRFSTAVAEWKAAQ